MQTGSEKIPTLLEKLGSAVTQLTVLRGAVNGRVLSALLGFIAAAETTPDSAATASRRATAKRRSPPRSNGSAPSNSS
jgi:hypothetical protein